MNGLHVNVIDVENGKPPVHDTTMWGVTETHRPSTWSHRHISQSVLHRAGDTQRKALPRAPKEVLHSVR